MRLKNKETKPNLEKLIANIPKQTAQEKIVRKTLSVLGEAEYRLKVKDKAGHNYRMAYAKGLLESLLFKDDEVKNENPIMQ